MSSCCSREDVCVSLSSSDCFPTILSKACVPAAHSAAMAVCRSACSCARSSSSIAKRSSTYTPVGFAPPSSRGCVALPRSIGANVASFSWRRSRSRATVSVSSFGGGSFDSRCTYVEGNMPWRPLAVLPIHQPLLSRASTVSSSPFCSDSWLLDVALNVWITRTTNCSWSSDMVWNPLQPSIAKKERSRAM
jgi:hypothetical protein